MPVTGGRTPSSPAPPAVSAPAVSAPAVSVPAAGASGAAAARKGKSRPRRAGVAITPPASAPAPRPRRGRPGYDLDTLVDGVVEVFMAKGFDGTSMEDLSKRLGISKSAIYHHVASKDELLGLAIGRALDGLTDLVRQNQQMESPAIERIEHLVRGSVAILLANRPFVALLLRVRGNTDVERGALERRREFDRYVAGLVREAVAEGSVDLAINPDITARLIFGMVNSLTEWVRPSPAASAPQIADAICQIAFRGITVDRSDAEAVGTPA